MVFAVYVYSPSLSIPLAFFPLSPCCVCCDVLSANMMFVKFRSYRYFEPHICHVFFIRLLVNMFGLKWCTHTHTIARSISNIEFDDDMLLYVALFSLLFLRLSFSRSLFHPLTYGNDARFQTLCI